uniref:Uncharacterized protein n=1 Tax=Anguilla anguilla TaxID=7936 RepID=A0A0E9UPT4_ANGAN
MIVFTVNGSLTSLKAPQSTSGKVHKNRISRRRIVRELRDINHQP